MKKILLILPFFLLTILSCKAQDKEPSDFIPKGYTEFKKYSGDLNKDGLEDYVLIIKKTDSANVVMNRFDKKVDRNRRGIIVLFKNANGYELADKNLECFSSENEDGGVYFAPELWIEIKDNKLYIHYGHGRYGYWKYTFRFQKSNFELIGYDSSSNRGPVTNRETSINFLTKKKLTKENTNENAEGGDEIFKENWYDIEIDNLIKLSEIKDFDELDMYNY
ncbi:hypothetical protein [Croceibacter atlanticus]|jgi:hypothetical protein|uniref:Lipoprotein n=1 Tax=Croceibacter atlanticus (strain ATCC BAA-628 / JCM 21780 / CIP 108009 / IAM 15332 / KCTC 12090 / HTCC2559) TaxID=216432 RepID=A3U7Z1_CROAH|nr:hypothetical protein [Croceibacter atlanticus]EAP88358.1 hypothetical protein CA2559_06345 [Croceibacter atlanticus HTCC2559]MBW4969506.1 hypothetical protein [Croceibacter atlanticus]